MRGNVRSAAGAVLGIAMLFSAQRPAMAEAAKPMCPICAKSGTDETAYAAKAGATLVRGAANTLLGWTELIRQPVQETKAGGNVLVGIGKGVGHGVMRTVQGMGEVLTFWTPKVQHNYLHFSKDCPICMGRREPQKD